MLTRDFQIGDVFGTVRKFNPRGGAMDNAVINAALRKFYPELESLGDTVTTENLLGFTRLGSIDMFSKLATHVVEIFGLGFDWPSVRAAKPEEWQKAYEDYLYNNSDVWDEINKLANELDNPNGEISGVLTEAQAKDPLSSNGVVSTLTI